MNNGLTEPHFGSRPNTNEGKLHRGLIGVLGAVLFAAVFYFLMLPAFSSSANAYCGSEEHSHSEECYSQTLICGLSEDEDVGEEGSEPAGGKADAAASHVHSEDCYQVEKVLTCTLSEEPADSDPDADVEAEMLDSSEDDLSSEGPAEDGGDTPDSTTHVHTDSCYEEIATLICGYEDASGPDDGQGGAGAESQELAQEPHVHSDACYESTLTCELGEHLHSLQCYSNPQADLETSTDWEAMLPTEGELSGVWADDLLMVAESQLGYEESSANYWVAESGDVKGYTRYGAWYGDAYGDWCAMFVSFCLHYAGIPTEAVPHHSNCQSWIELLSSEALGLYYPVGAYAEEGVEPFEPLPGDIVFFDWNADGTSDHVGIVVELVAGTEGEPAKVRTIEGNSADRVQYREYALDDATIMGYGMLPINNEEEPSEFASTLHVGADASGMFANQTMLHSSKYGNYQRAEHKIGDSKVVTFVLIPKSEFSDDWRPDPYPLDGDQDWSAKLKDTNYIVTYCCDLQTYTGSDIDYTPSTMDEARFNDPALRSALNAIIQNSYPYITETEMRQKLPSNLSCCKDSEYIAATQWAIWQLTTLDADLSTYESHHVSNGGTNGVLKQVETGHGSDTEHVEAIKEWLLDQTPLADLAVTSAGTSVTQQNDSSYTLTVTVGLNREVLSTDKASFALVAGGKSETVSELEGQNSFVVSLSGLSAEEARSARIVINAEHMQAYYFDADDNQDFVGGNWETYSVSYGLDSETTSVSVAKLWSEENPGEDSIEARLLADGGQYGDAVALSSDNSWSYIWEGLPKFDLVTGVEISYSVEETSVVDGYLVPSVTSVESSSMGTVKGWIQANSVEAGGTYLLVSQNGALGVAPTNMGRLSWRAFDLGDGESIETYSQWVASSDSGGVVLTNKASGQKLQYSSNFTMGGEGTAFAFSDGHISYASSGGGMSYSGGTTIRYFTGMNTNGVGLATTDATKATSFTWYKLSDVSLPAADKSFTITNTKIPTTSVKVTKVWEGRSDGDYPKAATVQLYQVDAAGQGSACGEPVELNEGKGWAHTWADLPVTDRDGNTIEYFIEEAPIEDYEPSIELVIAESADVQEYVLTNTLKAYVLPETGGAGTAALGGVGLALTVLAAALFLRRFEKRGSGR